MATLHIRNVPDGLYKRLRGRARRGGGSINSQVIEILSHSDELQTQVSWLETVKQSEELTKRYKLPPTAKSLAESIREDRDSH